MSLINQLRSVLANSKGCKALSGIRDYYIISGGIRDNMLYQYCWPYVTSPVGRRHEADNTTLPQEKKWVESSFDFIKDFDFDLKSHCVI